MTTAIRRLCDWLGAEPLRVAHAVYRYDAPPCFANAQDFRRRAKAAVEHALDALDRTREELPNKGITFTIARVEQGLRDGLAAAGLLAKTGRTRSS